MYNFRSRRSKGKWPTTAELLDLGAGKRRDEEQETGHRATRPSPWGSSTLALSTSGPYIFDKLYILHVFHFICIIAHLYVSYAYVYVLSPTFIPLNKCGSSLPYILLSLYRAIKENNGRSKPSLYFLLTVVLSLAPSPS